jgi:hypothetical protein
MTASNLQDTLAELNELSQFFITAEAQIRQGQEVDLSGVESRISCVCLAVQNAIPEQQQLYLPELNVLLSLLDSCEMALRTMQTSADQANTTQQQR